MDEYESLNHTKWECKYHGVFIPKYRGEVLCGSLRTHLGSSCRELARHKACEIGEGHLLVDHVGMLISIPPRYSVSQVMGYMKGNSAIHIARTYGGKRREFVGQHFWPRECWVSTVGHNEAAMRLYIQEQEKADQRLDQLGLFGSESRFERFTIYRPPALPEVADWAQLADMDPIMQLAGKRPWKVMENNAREWHVR